MHFTLIYRYILKDRNKVVIVEWDVPVSAKTSVVIDGVMGQSASSLCGCCWTVFGKWCMVLCFCSCCKFQSVSEPPPPLRLREASLIYVHFYFENLFIYFLLHYYCHFLFGTDTIQHFYKIWNKYSDIRDIVKGLQKGFSWSLWFLLFYFLIRQVQELTRTTEWLLCSDVIRTFISCNIIGYQY